MIEGNGCKFKLANKQRLLALKFAFKTIDVFIEPSFTPDIGKKYKDVKDYLLNIYSKK